MRVNVEQPYTLAETKPKLEAEFPDYKIKFRGPKVLVISQGNFIRKEYGAGVLQASTIRSDQ